MFWLPILLFSLLWLDLIRLLSGNWEAREQYAYGWFVPIFALGLLLRRWLDRPAPLQPSGRSFLLSGFCYLLCLLLLPLRVIFEINTDWPLIAWAYALITVGLTFYAFYLAGGWPWVRHFAFPVAFILVAVVWPYRIEKGLTQNLMQVAAALTVEIIGWFGVPAFQRGNLIEISTGVLGVDEACSGIRSFQSTLMAALFLGELYRLRVWARAGLVLSGLLFAFGFNVIRTLFLTWEANRAGISAVDKWHDPAGFTIAIACFFVLWGIAVLVKRKWGSEAASAPPTGQRNQKPGASGQKSAVSGHSTVLPPSVASLPPSDSAAFRTPRFALRTFLIVVGCWAVLCILATEIWYRAHTATDSGRFAWTVAMPRGNPTYQDIELPPRTLKLLSFDEGASGKWTDDNVEWNAHFFRWKPRSVEAVITSRVHRPEVCLPASGLQQIGNSKLVTFDAVGLSLPFRAYTFQAEGRALYVFFCQWEDGMQQQTGMQASNQAGRLQSVLSGRRLVGQQTFELILTGFDSLAAAENAVRQHLPKMVVVGSSHSPHPLAVGERS